MVEKLIRKSYWRKILLSDKRGTIGEHALLTNFVIRLYSQVLMNCRHGNKCLRSHEEMLTSFSEAVSKFNECVAANSTNACVYQGRVST